MCCGVKLIDRCLPVAKWLLRETNQRQICVFRTVSDSVVPEVWVARAEGTLPVGARVSKWPMSTTGDGSVSSLILVRGCFTHDDVALLQPVVVGDHGPLQALMSPNNIQGEQSRPMDKWWAPPFDSQAALDDRLHERPLQACRPRLHTSSRTPSLQQPTTTPIIKHTPFPALNPR